MWFGLCKRVGISFCISLNLISFFADKKKCLVDYNSSINFLLCLPATDLLKSCEK